MKINISEFRDKVHACWIGKNTVVIEAIAEGRVTAAYIPINFVGV